MTESHQLKLVVHFKSANRVLYIVFIHPRWLSRFSTYAISASQHLQKGKHGQLVFQSHFMVSNMCQQKHAQQKPSLETFPLFPLQVVRRVKWLGLSSRTDWGIFGEVKSNSFMVSPRVRQRCCWTFVGVMCVYIYVYIYISQCFNSQPGR